MQWSDISACRFAISRILAYRHALAFHFRPSSYISLTFSVSVARWEPIELVRKLVLTGFVLLIPESRSFLRLVVALLFTLVFMTLYLQLKPFKSDENDLIAVAGQIGLVCVLLGAGYLKLFEDISQMWSSDEAEKIMGFPDTTSMVTIMLLFTIGLVVLSFITVLYKVGTVEAMVTVKLKKSGNEPELLTYKQMSYHTFLSHVTFPLSCSLPPSFSPGFPTALPPACPSAHPPAHHPSIHLFIPPALPALYPSPPPKGSPSSFPAYPYPLCLNWC